MKTFDVWAWDECVGDDDAAAGSVAWRIFTGAHKVGICVKNSLRASKI